MESGRGSTRGDDSSNWQSLRWLVALVVLVVAVAILMPLAVDAVRDLVALTD